MNVLVITLFVTVFAAEFLVKKVGIAHSYFVLLPELLSAIALLVLLKYLLAGRRWALDWRYVLFLGLYLFIVGFGFLAQAMPAGAIVAGMRSYLKFIPFFLLPAVYPFTRRQIGIQLAVLFTLFFVQSPLAVYQRFVQYAGSFHTGDPISGLSTSSGVLSILMTAAVAAVVSMYLRRKITFKTMLIGIAVFVVPTTLNETKATLVLMPVALFLPAFFMPRGSRAWRKLVPIGAIAVVAGLAFISAYDYFIQNREYTPTIESFLSEGHARSYLYSGAADGERRYVGRLDSIVIAARRLADDPITFAFGFGAGNVSASVLPGFDGQYVAYFDRFGVGLTQITSFLWEIGFAGVALCLWFYFLVWRDARALAKGTDVFGLLGQVWATVTVVMALTLLYLSIFSINEIGYLFWFYSGLVASTAARQRWARRSIASVPEAPREEWLAASKTAGVTAGR
jgi:hypothetical protein